MGETTPAGPMRTWLDAPRNAPLRGYWGEGDHAAAFQAFYTTLLTEIRRDPRQALAALDRMSASDRRRLSPFDRVRTTRLRAHVLSVNGRFPEAARHYALAWRGFGRIKARHEQGITGIGWVTVLTQLGDYPAAIDLARKSRSRLERADATRRARLDANLGILYKLSGRVVEAATTLRGARKRLLRLGLEPDAMLVTYNLGQTLTLLGDAPRARRVLGQALAFYETHQATTMVLYCRISLAEVDLIQGKWNEGVAALDDLVVALESHGDRRAAAHVLREQGKFLFSLGILERAERMASRSHAAFSDLGLQTDTAETADLHGRILSALGRYMDARVRLEQAARYWTDSSNPLARHRTGVELAHLLLEHGEPHAARRRLDASRRYLDRRDRHQGGVRCRHLLARLHLGSGRWGTARRLARSAYDDARHYPRHLDRPWIALTLARACLGQRRPTDALRWAKRSVELMERTYMTLGTQAMRGQISATRETIYEGVVDLALQLPRADAHRIALDLLARARSPQLVEDLLRRDPALGADLRASITRMRDELLASEGGSGEDTRTRILGGRSRDLDKSLERLLAASPSMVRQAWASRGLDHWAQTVRGHSVVFYDKRPTGWAAFVLDPNGSVRLVPLPGVETMLAASWTSLRMLFEQAASLPARRRGGFLDATLEESQGELESLRRVLWDPLAAAPGRVFLIPAGSLSALPIESLVDTHPRGRDWIVSRWPHPTLISLSGGERPSSALLLHDGTADTQREAAQVARVLRTQGVRVETGDRRECLASGTGRLGVFHVAAHGAYHRERWLLNGIRLKDGWMGFEQLRPARFRNALMVFGSCESGLGSAAGSGFDGWLTAGLGAGASEMVLTLWKVDHDSAAAFSRGFYPGWCKGLGAPAAAAAARAAIRARRPHPFAWAPYLAVG